MSLYNDGAKNAFAITPSDTVFLTKNASALYVGGTGNITCVTAEGDTVLFTAIPEGAILPINVKRVNATATTATLIIGLVA